jgi:hypothetical protein
MHSLIRGEGSNLVMMPFATIGTIEAQPFAIRSAISHYRWHVVIDA